jgi:branched-subunit amino acid aminotransferase/4-amino-4-deoxychorismate lyase
MHGAVGTLVERCGLADARVRVTLTAGARSGPNLLIQARENADYLPETYERGIRLRTAAIRRNEASPLSRLKTTGFAENLMARDEARRAGADEALLLNGRGLVAEGSTSNVFAVRRGQLVTPRIEDGALPGVTRGAVLDLAASLGLKPETCRVRPKDLLDSAEVFVTNAIAGVLPVVAIDATPVGDGRPGAATARLSLAYEECAAAAASARA